MHKILFIVLAFLATCSAVSSCAFNESSMAVVKNSGSISGYLQDEHITEASGITQSLRRPETFWIINDSGHAPMLFAVQTDGELLAEVAIEGVANLDWEDLSSFELDGHAWLLIADIGDNENVFANRVFYVIEEPQLDANMPHSLRPEWEIRFRYPYGPRDAESAMVDVENERILLLSKRTEPPELYELPLRPTGDDEVAVAKLLGPIDTLPKPTARDLAARPDGKPGRFFWEWQPTAMDISADGRSAVILTYNDAYLYARDSSESWYKALQRQPVALNLNIFPGAESIVFAGSQRLIITSEGSHAALQEFHFSDNDFH